MYGSKLKVEASGRSSRPPCHAEDRSRGPTAIVERVSRGLPRTGYRAPAAHLARFGPVQVSFLPPVAFDPGPSLDA